VKFTVTPFTQRDCLLALAAGTPPPGPTGQDHLGCD